MAIKTKSGTWLTTKEVAERLGCSRYTVYALADRGKLERHWRDGARGCWYLESEVEAVAEPWRS